MWRSHRIQTKQNSFDLFFLSAFFLLNFLRLLTKEYIRTHKYTYFLFSNIFVRKMHSYLLPFLFLYMFVYIVRFGICCFFFILLSIIVLNFYRKSALQHNHRHIQTESKTTKSSSNAMNFENAHFNAFERYIDGLCDGGSAPQKYHQICTWCVVRF